MLIAILFVLGLFFGSFINALVWRVHSQDQTKRDDEKPKELSIVNGRSMCVECRHKLSAKDLVPILSWVGLRGRCRYCQEPIHWQYPAVELLTAALFTLSYSLLLAGVQSSIQLVVQFGLWLIILTGLIALTVYDLRWMLLPNRIVYPLIAVAGLLVGIEAATGGWHVLLSALYAVGIAGGIFFLLYQISSGKWIGGGDVKLGVLIGLIVLDPLKAFLVLFLASVIGTLLIVPGLALKKVSAKTRIPFGPFLILAALVVFFCGDSIIFWYNTALLGF